MRDLVIQFREHLSSGTVLHYIPQCNEGFLFPLQDGIRWFLWPQSRGWRMVSNGCPGLTLWTCRGPYQSRKYVLVNYVGLTFEKVCLSFKYTKHMTKQHKSYLKFYVYWLIRSIYFHIHIFMYSIALALDIYFGFLVLIVQGLILTHFPPLPPNAHCLISSSSGSLCLHGWHPQSCLSGQLRDHAACQQHVLHDFLLLPVWHTARCQPECLHPAAATLQQAWVEQAAHR